MAILHFDIEVAFHKEITQMALDMGIDEKRFGQGRFGPIIDAATKYVTHISFAWDKGKTTDLSVLDMTEKEILQNFITAWNMADEVVAHYGKKFDLKFLNSRIEKHKLPRLKPVRMIDTWRVIKDNFILPDNRLDTAIKYFKCPYEKPNLPWSVWQAVSLGDKKAIKVLRNRCKYDVLSLRWMYKTYLYKYSTRAVNRALAYEKVYIDDKSIADVLEKARCPECTTKGKLIRKGYNYGKSKTSIALKCTKCLDWSSASIKKDGTIGRIK